jgi:hypothetical protein
MTDLLLLKATIYSLLGAFAVGALFPATPSDDDDTMRLLVRTGRRSQRTMRRKGKGLTGDKAGKSDSATTAGDPPRHTEGFSLRNATLTDSSSGLMAATPGYAKGDF